MKYGILCYKTNNVGDEIQSIAAKNFLPKIDFYLDRENLDKVKNNQKIKLIMNGWFMHNPKNWPPSDSIIPLFISFHIYAKGLTSKESLAYFKKHEPIGCRDIFTYKLLKKKGVKSYFSGCLTLTLRNKYKKRNDKILLVDVSPDIKKIIPKKFKRQIICLSFYNFPNFILKLRTFFSRFKKSDLGGFRLIYLLLRELKIDPFLEGVFSKIITRKTKFRKAEMLLDEFAKARLVITSRMHCALPCLAFGTPVIFISENLEDKRFLGYLKFLRHYSLKDLRNKKLNINFDNPPPNPKDVGYIRKKLIKICRRFIKSP